MQLQPFSSFLKAHHELSASQLLADWAGLSFLLVAPRGAKPLIATLVEGAAAEDEDDSFLPGIESGQFEIEFHPGLQGWVLVAITETSVDDRRVEIGNPLLLSTGAQIRSLRYPSTRVQFYTPEALAGRLRKAGATRRASRVQVRPAKVVAESEQVTVGPPAVSQKFAADDARGVTFLQQAS